MERIDIEGAIARPARVTPLQLSHRDAELAALWYARGRIDSDVSQRLGLTYGDASAFAELYADTRGRFATNVKGRELSIAEAWFLYVQAYRPHQERGKR